MNISQEIDGVNSYNVGDNQMSILSQIKNVVQQFAEAASEALRVDVEVYDLSHRIAGTGKTKEFIGKKIKDKGIINRFMFQFDGAKRIIVDHPGEDEKCRFCFNYGKCIYKKAVYAAIEHEEKTIGAIGIIAINDEQVGLIEYNDYAMLDFVDKIAKLISTKVQEHKILKQVRTYAELMTTVIDNINKGVVILNKNFVIININNYLVEKLWITKEQAIYKDILSIFPDLILREKHQDSLKQGYQEINYTINGKQIYLLCTLKSIEIGGEVEGYICLLEDYTDTKQLAYAISTKQDVIFLKDIIGQNIHFIKFKRDVKNVAMYDSTVLLTGETGTGKELFARAIHAESNRKDKPFIAINCGAIPETLIESEFFGYEKGAFTGANSMGKHGKFYMADKGSIFLDEIETMPLYLQPKLLRVIERREIERIGGIESIPIDVRIIAATNAPLDEMVKKGEFREDLYHRLNVVSLFIPPLRERGQDVLILAEYFIKKFSDKFHKNILGLTDEVKKIFLNYHWKGNVRELQNTIEYAINMEQSNYITVENLPLQLKQSNLTREFMTLEDMEREYIKKALNQFGYTEEGRIEAAKHLGISRATIYRKIKKYKLV